jgi:putative NADPH-quinone reductase
VNVLTIYAHHNPHSLCHALLEQFDAGLRDGGHINHIVDLHANGFNPILGNRDGPNRIDDFALHFPSIRDVQHEYFYAGYGAAPKAIAGYLDRAYELGLHFDQKANT